MGNGASFSWRFSGQCYIVFLAVSPVSLTELCLFWYSLKDLFSLPKLVDKAVPDPLKVMTSQGVDGTVDKAGRILPHSNRNVLWAHSATPHESTTF